MTTESGKLKIERVKALDGMTSSEEVEFLSELAQSVTDGVIVEIGSYRGKSAAALALGSSRGAGQAVYAVDPHQDFSGPLGGSFGDADRAGFYEAMLATGAYRLVRPVNLTSLETAACWRRPVALLFIDGDHRYEAVQSDIDAWRPHLLANAVVAFDDVNHPELGPHRVAEQLLSAREFSVIGQVGKILAMRRNSAADHPVPPRGDPASDLRDLNAARLRRNTYVSRRHRLLYVSVAKAACTAMKHLLADLEGETVLQSAAPESWEVEADLLVHDRHRWRMPSLADLSEAEQNEVLTGDGYFRFALVRNPFTRAWSAWQSKLLLREPLQVAEYRDAPFFNLEIGSKDDIASAFEGFLEFVARREYPSIRNDHWALQTTLLCRDRVSYDRIGKVEDVSELLSKLGDHLARFGATLPPLVRRNEGLIPWDPALLTRRCVELIRELYKDDFDVLGYSREPPGPQAVLDEREWRTAIAVIRMIRARHERLAVMFTRLKEQSAALRAMQALTQALTSERTPIRRLVNRTLTRIFGMRLVRSLLLSEAARRAANAGQDTGARP